MSALSNTMVITRRDLLHIKSDPEQIVGMTAQPIMFLVLFVYVFGGAIADSSSGYIQFVLPGILVQSVSFIGFYTAIGLNKDFQAGLIDRFRSLPIARSAVVAGRILSDAVRVAWSVLIITVFGMVLGFRFSGGFVGGIGGLLLITLWGIVMCWPMAYMGIIAKTPEAVNNWGFMIILPLTFASTVFVPAETMPGWLEAFANVNPVSLVADASRGLMLGGEVKHPLFGTLIAMVLVVAVFAPLTVARYRKRV